jgi:hypothetical protein
MPECLPQIRVLSDEFLQAMLELKRHLDFGERVVVRGLDGLPVARDVFHARTTAGQMLLEFGANVGRQFFLDEIEEQPLGVPTAVTAEVQDAFQYGSGFH